MRILIATAHRNLVGGVEKYLQGVMPALLDRGHEVGLLYEETSDVSAERIDPASARIPTWCAAELGTVTLDRVAQWKPEVVYSHGFGAGSSPLEPALVSPYPTVLYAHNLDATCATGRKYYAFPKPRCCSRKLGPMCLLLHYPRRCGGLHPGTMWRRYRHHMKLNSQLARHRAILVASNYMHQEFLRNGVSAQQLHLVPLPSIDSIPGDTAPVRRAPEGRILFVGRLTDLKGTDYLIRAIPKAAEKLRRPLTLTIAGDGPERPNLERVAGRLGISVEFAGWVHTRQKLDLMRQADLLAVPSLWPEPFGLVGIEAGSLGVPAVAFAVGGILDWLIPGESGELASSDPPTVEGLAEAMVRSLADPAHHARLSLGAWKIAKHFSMENHIAQLEPILSAAVTRAGSPDRLTLPVLG